MQHGVAVLFIWAFAVQAGVPAPAGPMLMSAGVLCGSGRMDLAIAVAAAMAATLVTASMLGVAKRGRRRA